MSRLIRLDRTGHTTLAEWTARRQPTPRSGRSRHSGASSTTGCWPAPRRDGQAEVVRELPLDAELVILRRPIAGG